MVEKGLTIGQYLRRQREAEKIPLESVAGVTRITSTHLKAIERDEFHLLPAEIFTRGYIRSYAKVIHLDPVEIIDAYQLQTGAKNIFTPEKKAALPPSTFKNIKMVLADFVATIMGASPAFSPGKIPFSPKD
jgi:cytoskeletal protein RodZ